MVFKKNDVDVLVVIDVVSCGLDISGVSYVFNYYLFLNIESYIYCIGRIG